MRADRYTSTEKHLKQENKARSKRKKKKQKKQHTKRNVLLILILFFLAILAAEIVMLRSMISVDKRFTRSIERGVYAGWELDVNELQLQETGRITDTSFIKAEREAIDDYINKKFTDDELGSLANEYIASLKACQAAAARHNPEEDYDAFWAEFSEPYGRRVRALYRLSTGDFDMPLDSDDHIDESEYLHAQGWLLNMVKDLKFSQKKSGRTHVFRAVQTNDSGCYIEYLNLDVELLSKDGKVVETASVYVSGISPNERMHLEFISTSSKAVKYRIVSETCKLQKNQRDEESSDDEEFTDSNGEASADGESADKDSKTDSDEAASKQDTGVSADASSEKDTGASDGE